jgi:hypothetical protein
VDPQHIDHLYSEDWRLVQLLHVKLIADTSGVDLPMDVQVVEGMRGSFPDTRAENKASTQALQVQEFLEQMDLGGVVEREVSPLALYMEEVRASSRADREAYEDSGEGDWGSLPVSFYSTLAIDIAVVKERLAVEFDGGQHYMTSWTYDDGSDEEHEDDDEDEDEDDELVLEEDEEENPSAPSAIPSVVLQLSESGLTISKRTLLRRLGWDLVTIRALPPPARAKRAQKELAVAAHQHLSERALS